MATDVAGRLVWAALSTSLRAARVTAASDQKQLNDMTITRRIGAVE
jgi:hypothetical protein